MDCPLCDYGGGGGHLGWDTEKGWLHCWRCGFLKPLVLIQAWLHCTRERALTVLREHTTGRPQQRTRRARTASKASTPVGLAPCSKVHIRYLTSPPPKGRGFTRGFAKEVIHEWDLKGTKVSTKGWDWRIVAPIKNRDGMVQAYVGRTIGVGVKPKYKVTEDSGCAANPKTFLYGIEKVAETGTVIIVEGPADAWNMGPGAVATLGTGFKREQVSQLAKFPRRFICFDPDGPGVEAAEKLAEWLSVFPGQTKIIEGLCTDPGSLSQAEIKAIRKEVKI